MSKRWPDDSSGEEEKAVERELRRFTCELISVHHLVFNKLSVEGVYSDTEDGMDAVLARQQPANGPGEKAMAAKTRVLNALRMMLNACLADGNQCSLFYVPFI